MIVYSKCGEKAPLSTGFYSWSKALDRFNKHAASTFHKEAEYKLKQTRGDTVIHHLATKQLAEQEEHYRCLLKVDFKDNCTPRSCNTRIHR